MILLGVCLCVIGAAQDTVVDFSPSKIEELTTALGGAIYIFVLFSLVLTSVLAIGLYEDRYPYRAHVTPQDGDGCGGGGREMDAEEIKTASKNSTDVTNNSQRTVIQDVEAVETSQNSTDSKDGAVPPAWLYWGMSFLYPCSLGIDEGTCMFQNGNYQP